MNYRHAYHAGNAADVLKHVILVALLESLRKKDKPFCYLDTHAGTAQYDLKGALPQSTKEYQQGIGKLFNHSTDCPLIKHYLQQIASFNSNGMLRHYPGSSAIAAQLLRPHDKMIATELETDVYTTLKKYFAGNRQVGVHHLDGYQALKAFLPPAERRGLVLIDPPYEEADEFTVLRKKLVEAYVRWPTGIYAVWYPIKTRAAVDAFHRQLVASDIDSLFVAELCPWPTNVAQRLNGSGVVIINLPWQLDKELQTTLAVLLDYLKQNERAIARSFWLKKNT